MKVFVIIRTNQSDGPYLELNEDQIKEFYKKIVIMQGYPTKRNVSSGAYGGLMIRGEKENWKILRETVQVLNSDKEEIFFVDKDRELEQWLLELVKPFLDVNSINIINFDLGEILLFNEMP